jgi:Rod binding domain-containing protein
MGTSMIGPGGMNAQASVQQAKESQMLQQLSSAKAANDSAKIDKGAQQFEAMLLSTWLQQAEQSFGTVPGADDDEDAAGRSQMMSLGVQSLSESLAASGGIGIAKMIAKAMHAQADKAENSAQTGAQPASGGQIPAGNLSFRLNSGLGNADSRPDSAKGSK